MSINCDHLFTIKPSPLIRYFRQGFSQVSKILSVAHLLDTFNELNSTIIVIVPTVRCSQDAINIDRLPLIDSVSFLSCISREYESDWNIADYPAMSFIFV